MTGNAPLIRRTRPTPGHTYSGPDNGDLDVCFQLFSCGCVWDGALVSKSSRDHLVRHGYAVRHRGGQSLTGCGTIAFLVNPHVWVSAWHRWRSGRNPFVSSERERRSALCD